MQHAENSSEHDTTESVRSNADENAAPVWTSPPLSRPPPHEVAGQVVRTIFPWETGIWQHEHKGPIFDWGLTPPVRLRVSCSLPPPPISRPPTHEVAGKAIRLSFYWEASRWDHEWENGTRLMASTGPLMEPSLPLLQVLSSPLDQRFPPHPVHGKVMFTCFSWDRIYALTTMKTALV